MSIKNLATMLTALLLFCLHALYRAFELKFGWFFVNGHKHEAWQRYLEKKYGAQANQDQSFGQFFRQQLSRFKKK
jgi:hypothetical protein